MLSFTVNIQFDDGTFTLPEREPVETEIIFTAALRLLRLVYPDGFHRKRLVDLGCLEGGHTLGFARAGFDALGIEVRNSNFANCQIVKSRCPLPNLSFVKDDARNVEKYGTFDVVFCSGLLYHMECPRAFIQTISACCSKALLINTHFASHENSAGFPQLGPITSHESCDGRWFDEAPAQTPTLRDRQQRWSSWEASKAFWLTRPCLMQALRDEGFDVILEQFDFQPGNIRQSFDNGLYGTQQRTAVAAIRL